MNVLISNLQDGMSLEEFLENLPTVTREQAIQVLEFLDLAFKKLAQAP